MSHWGVPFLLTGLTYLTAIQGRLKLELSNKKSTPVHPWLLNELRNTAWIIPKYAAPAFARNWDWLLLRWPTIMMCIFGCQTNDGGMTQYLLVQTVPCAKMSRGSLFQHTQPRELSLCLLTTTL